MVSAFYRVLADPKMGGRWFLDEPLAHGNRPIDARKFTQGVVYEGPTPVSVSVAQPGDVVNFNLAAFDAPITSERVASVIQQYAMGNVQRFPVAIGGCKDRFEILNVTSRVKCLDENRSGIMKWTPQDGLPEKIGEYRMVTSLWVDPMSCQNAHIFRVQGWEIALIISSDVKESIGRVDNLGVVFAPVT